MSEEEPKTAKAEGDDAEEEAAVEEVENTAHFEPVVSHLFFSSHCF